MDSIWNAIIDLRPVILVAIILGAAVLIAGYALSDNLDWGRRRMKFFGVFFGLRFGETLWLSAGLLKLAFVVGIVLFTVRIETIHMVFYIAVSGISIIFTAGVKNSLLELVNTVVAYAALTVIGIIFGYYRDVNGDPWLIAVYCLLSAFVTLYLLYFYIRGVGNLMLHKIASEDFSHDYAATAVTADGAAATVTDDAAAAADATAATDDAATTAATITTIATGEKNQ
ncbi:MAG: hypothetical protein LBJ91_07420 [Clostridiales Family XIII bacterium]|jgi:hypothetical protein|nr:hypothetical protein [Clostridiales Family XIII bacterium]